MNIDRFQNKDEVEKLVADLKPEHRDKLLVNLILAGNTSKQAPEPICMPIRKYCETYGLPENVIRQATHSKYRNLICLQREGSKPGTTYIKVQACNKLWLEGKLLELM